ncbi:MAG: DNA methyltransferase [Candidatus Kapabacteria bacterium]|nr:DNA methyltransferase [Candidatus Kapabacteria bacterium]
MAKQKQFERGVSAIHNLTLDHLNRQIPPEAHTAMYNFHKYWSRKTWNVVGKYIENYCPKGGIVYDPFGGSGITAMEALKSGRKVIISDLNPIAIEITRLTIKLVNLLKLNEAYLRIEELVKDKINDLYKTQCRKCKNEFPFDVAIWLNGKISEVRYYKCPACGDQQKSSNPALGFDFKQIDIISKTEIKQWYPKNRLYHVTGKPFMKKEHYESVDELFTKRNLLALAILMEAIETEKNKDLRDFLKIGFSSMIHLCSSMTPVRPTRPMSSAWTQHSYWSANEFMEQNVWEKFESAIIGKQGLIKAKEEANKYYENIQFARKFEDVIEGDADVFIYHGDCLELMNKIYKKYGDDGCIDYIFTDPPYDSSIQYGELSFMWVAWLKLDNKYLENVDSKEIIHNEKQNKDFTVYTALLQNSFRSMFNLLKDNHFLTMTFHNPTFKVRNSTIRTGVLAGFELQKIHHQDLAHASPKSLLQPFGSAQGDFYLRFHKPDFGKKGFKPELIDELRFEKIVIETTTKILAERGEPTPYTIIINAIDPELTKQGYFSELDTGLDSEAVLKKHLNDEFCLVEGKLGASTGKLWWFQKPNMVPHLEKIPLSERVEQTVLRQLQSKGKVTFTDIWEAVSIAFPNSLTSDQSNIKNTLEDYARPVSEGIWMIKSNFIPGTVEKEHTTIMAMIAEIGKIKGFKIYIGKVEQTHKIDSKLVNKEFLKDYMDYPNLFHIKNSKNIDVVDDIDVLWIKDDKIEFVFEVESTTSMTSALQRGSNIDAMVPKIMLFPSDRFKQFERKMKTPMFFERYYSDNWKFVIFEELYKAWNKKRIELILDEIINIGVIPSVKRNGNENQLTLDY